MNTKKLVKTETKYAVVVGIDDAGPRAG